jgi:hypothetical protein
MVDNWEISSSTVINKLQYLFHKQIKIQVFLDIQTCQLLNSSDEPMDQVASISRVKH